MFFLLSRNVKKRLNANESPYVDEPLGIVVANNAEEAAIKIGMKIDPCFYQKERGQSRHIVHFEGRQFFLDSLGEITELKELSDLLGD
ncbi:MAG: hypothetical protein ACD_7C00299G0002 [uncultured bacterium]|nr:MAG: hypothetical protein ACD_7C00299G0002 [uncultured bacterium]HBR79634.1 hypothetical protein [Candidatus Moranbacteria bacterium]